MNIERLAYFKLNENLRHIRLRNSTASALAQDFSNNINLPKPLLCMDLDIMQALVDLLCPTAGAQSSCQQFISAPHHMTLEPFGPLIYFLFFPWYS